MGVSRAAIHERREFLEITQAKLVDNLQRPEVVEALQSSPLAGEYNIDPPTLLLDAAKQLYIPNIRGDRIIIPAEYRQSDSVPFISIDDDETYSVCAAGRTQSPGQKQVLAAKVVEWSAGKVSQPVREVGRINKLLKAEEDTLALNNQDGATNFNSIETSIVNEHGAREKRAIIGRPMIVVDRHTWAVPSVVVVHELWHSRKVQDNPTKPLAPADARAATLEEELEAYNLSALYGRVMLNIGEEGYWAGRYAIKIHNIVETVRNIHADPARPFYPNKDLRLALRNARVALLTP